MSDSDASERHLLDLQDGQAWTTVYWPELERRIGSVFAHSGARARALAYLAGLLSQVERKNSWQLAEISGAPNPYGFQYLLGRADWQADALRDELRAYVTSYLADDGAIGVINETSFLKKGRQSVGVAQQICGTASRTKNCQIGVFLAYTSLHGHTLLDRELYLPAEWFDDHERCRAAGIPGARAFATRPALARQMLERAFGNGIQLAWLTSDTVYGDDHILRQWLEARLQPYVLAVSGKEEFWIEQRQQTIKDLLEAAPNDSWERISARTGSNGPRWYDWQRWSLAEPAQPGWNRWLLLRRSITASIDVTAYIVYAPVSTTVAEHVHVAEMRWMVEDSIQMARTEVGLDQYEVRSWTGWYRYITLAMWAQAFLTVLRKETRGTVSLKGGALPTGVSSMAAFKAHRPLQPRRPAGGSGPASFTHKEKPR